MNKKIASALVGLGLFGASLGVAQTAFAQETPDTGPGAVAAAFQDAESDAPDGEENREGRHGRRGRGCHLETAAETIGITVDELRAGLDAGQSIAQVAEANGVSTDAVIDALTDEAAERIDAKVAAGDLTAEEAATKLADKTARIEERVNSVRSDSPQA